MDSIENDPVGPAGAIGSQVLHFSSARFVVILFGVGICISAVAQTPVVPRSAFYLGVGGSYNSTDFGTQEVTAIGTSQVFENGMLVSTGRAAGPGIVKMPIESNFAPSVQAGYFRQIADGPWLWGAKFSYNYLNATSSVDNIIVPQSGSFTQLATHTTVPFVGAAIAQSYQTQLDHQLALMPFIGHSLGKGFVYLGVGPTGSKTQTNIKSLVGFADLRGQITDISGPPQDFSGSGWVVGGAGTLGLTYFLNHSWFLDIAYTFSMTRNQTFNYSSTFTNTQSPFGTTAGTLVGSSSGRVITPQRVTLTMNVAF